MATNVMRCGDEYGDLCLNCGSSRNWGGCGSILADHGDGATISLEQLFTDHSDPENRNFTNEFRVVARCDNGGVTIYIHPVGKDGATLDYVVSGDELKRIRNECQ